MRWIRAFGAGAALLAMIVGVPVLLVQAVGNPWPAEGIDLMAPLTDNAIIGVIAALTWFFWAQVMVCIVAEVISVVRDVDIEVQGSFNIQRQMARSLVGAVVVAVVGLAAAAGTTLDASAQTESVSQEPETPTATDAEPDLDDLGERAGEADAATDDVGPAVTLQQGESLMGLAETHLGDVDRWDEIGELNEGREMVDGRTFRASDRLRAGWVLQMPAVATTAASQASTSEGDSSTQTRTVNEGDFRGLWGIAEQEYDDGTEYTQIWEANKGKTMPSGRTFDDPDLIHPGDELEIPRAAGEDEPEPKSESRSDGEAEPDPNPSGSRATAGDDSRAEADADGGPLGADAGDLSSADQEEGRTEAVAPPGAEAGVDSDDEGEGLELGWIAAGVTGAGGLLAAAVLWTLRCRRLAQGRQRRPGHLPAAPEASKLAMEESITVVGEQNLETVELVHDALMRLGRATAASGAPSPHLAAVEVTDSSIAVHLREPAAAPSATSWVSTGDELLWVVDRGLDPSAMGPAGDAEDPAPWPLLVTIGRDSRGGTWLLNLEGLNVDVTGDPGAADDFTRHIGADLACNPWSTRTAVDLVGVAAEIAAISPERFRAHDDATVAARGATAHAVQTIDRLAAYNVDAPTARARQDDPDLWDSRALIVSAAAASESTMEQLHDLVRTHGSRTGVALVVNGAQGQDGFTLRIDERRRLAIPAVDLEVEAVGLTEDEAGACVALLVHAETATDVPPSDLEGDETWQSFVTTTGSLRAQYRTDRSAVTLEPSTSVLDEPDEAYTSVAATTPSDLNQVAPKVTGGVRETVLAADPQLDQDLEAWRAEHCARPRLSLLGEISARTSGTALAKRKPFYTELLAYLATRAHGATTEEVAEAIGVEPKRVRIDMSTLRGWLGSDPTTGAAYLPPATETPAAKDRGVGVYQVIDTLVDLDLMRRLRVRGEARGPQGITDLWEALLLVTGRPFSRPRTGGWKWLLEGERLDSVAVVAVVDIAHAVVGHELGLGEVERARAAVGIALNVAPDEEVSRLDLVAVLQAQGRGDEAEQIVLDDVCNRSDDGQAPVELAARTEVIIEAKEWLRREAV